MKEPDRLCIIVTFARLGGLIVTDLEMTVLEKTDGMKFTKKHEWVRPEGSKAYIGLSDQGQTLFGTIIFITVPKVGMEAKAGDSVGAVESMKATAKFHTPVSGTVIESNRNLIVDPERVNKAPYDEYFAVLEMSDPSETEPMMDYDQYDKWCRAGGKD